jgi:hypothetical protein
MMLTLAAPALPLTRAQRQKLKRMAVSTSLLHRKVVQAQALLLAADGVANEEIARCCYAAPDSCVHGGRGSRPRVSTESG